MQLFWPFHREDKISLCLSIHMCSCVCPRVGLLIFVIIIFLKTEWRKVGYFGAASCVCEWYCAFICVLMCPLWCALESGEEGQGSG